MLRVFAAVGCTLVALPARAAQTSEAEELSRQLVELVDLPTSAERAQAAARLAQSSPKLEEWLAAMASFGEFAALPAGPSLHDVELRAAGKRERTEVALFVPRSYEPSRPAPALLAGHGTGGRGSDVLAMWRAVAEEHGLLIVAPSESGPNDGYRFSERERDIALGALRWLRRHANVDERRVFATGISRGGHLAWDLALRYPDLFAGIAPMIGAPRITIQDGQNNLRYVENLRSLAIRDLQGERDDPALVWSVRYAFERLEAQGASDARLFLQPEHGHSFDFGAVDWGAFLRTAARDPRPERVVRVSARAREGRAFWVEVLDYAPSVEEEFTPKVSQLGWAQKSDDERRRYLIGEAEKRTSRIVVQRAAPGRISAQSNGVKRFRVLLTVQDFDPKVDVELAWNGDRIKRRLRPSLRVLLEEFAERFDRTYLPIAELEVR